MIRLGLVGYPLDHSLSPRLHTAALSSFNLEGEYRLYPIPPEDQDALLSLLTQLRQGLLTGLNVTIPHKQNVIPFLDELAPVARAIGAVNTLYAQGGRLIGHNTDALGFMADLQRFLSSTGHRLSDKRALVLGSGGGARAVVYALLNEGWKVTVAAVLMDQAAALVESFQSLAGNRVLDYIPNDDASLEPLLDGLTLVVNATPVGMFPKVNESPWPASLRFPPEAVVYDLIYNPRQTLFVQQAQRLGLKATTGLGMLIEQASLSFECWTGRLPSREDLWKAAEE